MFLNCPRNLPESLMFFHGTSYRCLEDIIKHGFFPETSFSVVLDRFDSFMRDRYIITNIKDFFDDEMSHYYSLEGAFRLAAEYARAREVYDYLYYELGLRGLLEREAPRNIISDTGELDFWDESWLLKEFSEKGYTQKKIEEELQIIDSKKGVVLGLNSIMLLNAVMEDIDFSEGFHINFPTKNSKLKVNYSLVQYRSLL